MLLLSVKASIIRSYLSYKDEEGEDELVELVEPASFVRWLHLHPQFQLFVNRSTCKQYTPNHKVDEQEL